MIVLWQNVLLHLLLLYLWFDRHLLPFGFQHFLLKQGDIEWFYNFNLTILLNLHNYLSALLTQAASELFDLRTLKISGN